MAQERHPETTAGFDPESLPAATSSLLLDVEGRIAAVDPGICGILAYSPHELLGRPIERLLHADDRLQGREWLSSVLNGEQAEVETTLRLMNAFDDARWIQISLRRSDPDARGPVPWQATLNDVTLRQEAVQALAREAQHHPVTRLPSRPAILEMLADVSRQARTDQTHGAVVLISVVTDDGEVTDVLRWRVASATLGALGDDGSLGHLDDDVFLAVLDDADEPAAASVAERLQAAISALRYAGVRPVCGVGSFGGQHGVSGSRAVARAQAALHRSIGTVTAAGHAVVAVEQQKMNSQVRTASI